MPFSPSTSWLHKCYSAELLQEVRVVKGLQTKWGICSRTVPFDSTTYALAHSNNLLAAGSWSGNIITFDTITGVYISILSGHTGRVNSLAFSSDGKFLVSGSDDKAVNLWDVLTGGIVKTFHGHTNVVYSVSFSMDHTMIASGSLDGTICLWNTQTGGCHHIIDQHGGCVSSVMFSPTNSKILISGSYGQTIQQWDINGHQIGAAYEGNYVAFSPDGFRFVLWGRGVAIIQNSDSGTVITTIHAPNTDFQCCCFSHNSKLVAGASGNIVYVWDITSSEPCLIETCVGHTGTITSLTFSSFLISSSSDRTIKFWQISTPSTAPVVTDLELIPPITTPIWSVDLYAKDGIAVSTDWNGVVRTWDTMTGLSKGCFNTPAEYLSQRDMCMVDNRLTITWCERRVTPHNVERVIYIWDTRNGRRPQEVEIGPDFLFESLRISGDGSKVFFLGEGCVQAFSTQTGEVVGEVRYGDQLSNNSLIVDGSRVWVQTRGLQGWDFGTPGSTPIPLSDMPPYPTRPHLDFVHGTKGRNTSPSMIKHTFTGEEVYRLPERYGRFTKVKWDGRYLITGYRSGEVLILDFEHMIAGLRRLNIPSHLPPTRMQGG